jgi:protein-glucosylgalactosylhydroxylysine glucosidase
MAAYDSCWTIWIGSNVPLTYTDSNVTDACVPDSNVTAPLSSASNIASDEVGLFLGNGKIGMITSFDGLDTDRAFITGDFHYNQGLFKTNTVPLFHTSHAKFFSTENADVQTTLVMQKLNMQFGIATSVFDIQPVSTELIAAGNPASLRVEMDLYAVRQFPFCTMTTLRITPSADAAELAFFHEPYADDTMSDVQFNNNIIYNDSIADQGIYVLNGQATSASAHNRAGVVFASTYLFENGAGSYENLGFNIYRYDAKRCYNKFVLKNLVANQVYKMHILSASMTTFDFESPLEEVKRILLSIVGRESTHTAVASNVVRKKHVSDWAALWASSLSLEPKTIITDEENAAVQQVRKHLRYSMYNIYASVREFVNNDVNPMNLSVVDYDGNVLMHGDLWLLPLLVLLKPDVVRSMLEHRYATLQTAIQLAAGYGYRGSKYPYVNDVVGYKNALYWDTVSPQHVFNSALIAVNVWNYFRVTVDNEWLRSKGYPIMKGVADFFVSLVVVEEETGTSYRTEQLYGLLRQGDNNAFTNMLIRLALRYALEASYELGYYVKQEWLDVYHLLQVPVHADINYDVLKLDDAATTSETYAILEPLILLVPFYSYVYFSQDPACFNVDSIYRNIDFYEARKAGDHPYNSGVLSILYGIGLQSQLDAAKIESSLSSFATYLEEFASKHTVGIWGNFRPPNINSKYNDITLSALYVLVLMLGMCGVKIQGGVSETKFYYEELKVTHNTFAMMPSTWAEIRAKGLAGKNLTFTVLNSITYPS